MLNHGAASQFGADAENHEPLGAGQIEKQQNLVSNSTLIFRRFNIKLPLKRRQHFVENRLLGDPSSNA